MPGLAALLAAALAVLALLPGEAVAPPPRREIVVIEQSGCLYCRLFRRDLAPAYLASPRAREVPLRFLDLDAVAASRLELSRAVDVVPTIILLADGSEVGRIPGYASRETFFHALNYLLSPSQ
jgi:thioredoxin-related protein